ncbi:MAG: AI-2E family transporter [Leptolyngbyaceae cyanobacterium SM1_1_3]|nr:AI-2E family transporter [Leptolyngbyaceae cyanobacterium SM1_1_3]NJN03698.1 AI-2E family transporter [Leptolyngbyaceae cyanobacterium RM1_1_2]
MNHPDPFKSWWQRLDNSALFRFLLLFACGWALVELLDYFEIVVVIFTSSTILAFLLNHPVRWLKRFLPHGLAVTIVFLVALVIILAIVGTMGLAVLSQGQSLLATTTDFLNSLTPVVQRLEMTLQSWQLGVDLETLGAQFREQAIALFGAGLGLLQGALANFINAILTAVVTFFMLLDGARIWDLVLKVLPVHRRQDFTQIVRQSLLGFFWGRLLLSAFYGVSTLVAFLLIKVPFALVLAVIAGLFDLIPGIGATLGIGLVALLLLSQSGWLALKIIVICIVLQQIEENVLLPHVMSDSLNMNPVVMFFALIVGARVAGLLGIFLSIPIAAVVISLLEIDEMKSRAQFEAANEASSES